MRRVRASWAYVPPPDHIEIWSKASASRSHDKPYSNTFGASTQIICWTWIETLFRYGHKNAPVNALAKSALPGAECVVCFPFSVVPVPRVFLFLCFPPPSLFPPLFFPTAKSGGDKRSMIRRHTHIGFNRPPTSRIGSLMKKAMASAKKKVQTHPKQHKGVHARYDAGSVSNRKCMDPFWDSGCWCEFCVPDFTTIPHLTTP